MRNAASFSSTWSRGRHARLLATIFILITFLLWSLSTTRLRSKPQEDARPAFAGPRNTPIDAGTHGFLSLNEARDLCQRRRWDVYSTRDQRRKVYDLFLINTELDWLEIRLHELDEVVDFFVVLESAKNFQRNPKPLYLQEHLAGKSFCSAFAHSRENRGTYVPTEYGSHSFRPCHRLDGVLSLHHDLYPLSPRNMLSLGSTEFKSYEHKLIHRVLQEPEVELPRDDVWVQEHFTRNALLDQVLLSLNGSQAPNEGDVLLIGDIDEIPRASTLIALRNCAFPPRVTLRSQMYYYSFQWPHRGEQWHHPQATYFDGPNTVRPEDLRQGKPDAELYSTGWHCSSCFSTMADLKTKITSFSHKDYNHPYFLDADRLLQNVRRGEDLFERKGESYDRIDENPDIPTYLRREENRQKFAYMLDRDPINANFRDV